MANCSRHHSQYVYHASAYGVAGEIERPSQHSIPTQAAAILPAGGGRAHQRVDDFHLDGMISFKSAYAETGGKFDECHNRHTSYATSVIEGLNILDVVTADRVVSRMAIYSPMYTPDGQLMGPEKGGTDEGDADGEHSFDITGSHFVNLRVAGKPIDGTLATHIFRKNNTYSKISRAYQSKEIDPWLFGHPLVDLKEKDLAKLESDYHSLGGISGFVREWKQGKRTADRGTYRFSVANHLDAQKEIGADSEVRCHGGIIVVPKFGVVRLGEMMVNKHCRTLAMLRVQMCSTGTGGSDVGGSHGSGGMGGP